MTAIAIYEDQQRRTVLRRAPQQRHPLRDLRQQPNGRSEAKAKEAARLALAGVASRNARSTNVDRLAPEYYWEKEQSPPHPSEPPAPPATPNEAEALFSPTTRMSARVARACP